MINVIVVDDHPIVREGIRSILSNFGLAVVGEASNGFEAIKVVETTPCDVVLLDISMPNAEGLDVLKHLHKRSPHLPILVLSIHDEYDYGLRALRAGAAGYLTKESAGAKIVDAILKVVRGGKYISETLAEELLYDSDTHGVPHNDLSDRELQILCMIASGKPVGLIAEQLSLSVKTVSTYRMRVREKLHMKNNAEMMRYAIKQGLVA